ncbi:MAG: universal stress protein [Marinoscillum sp.]
MMKILLTTDFSEASNHAIDYIVQLAGSWCDEQVSFVLVHSFTSLVPYQETSMMADAQPPSMPVIENKELQDQLEQKLEEQVNSLRNHINVAKHYFEIGSLAEVIEDLVEKESPDLIVMGTREKSAFERMTIGTNTLEVVTKTEVPVLAVPREASLEPVSRMSFALDLEREGSKQVSFLERWIKLNDCQLEVLTVSDEDTESAIEQRMKTSKFHQQLSTIDHDHLVVINEDIYEGITTYTNDQKPDMLGLIPGDRSFLDRVFHKNKTEKITYHLKIPVLLIK